ncbi:MAG: signal peptidase I [Bacteroidetes bacterium]|nr:signal peptidase I [Bacteroidota bacterium]
MRDIKNGNVKIMAKKAYDITKGFAVMILIVLIIKSSFVEASMVPTPSMENTILAGDFLIVNKFIYGGSTPRYIPFTNIRLPFINFPSLDEPDRFDILVFEYPGERDQLYNEEVVHYVKRCIGLPGDKIKIVDRVVFINGEELNIPPHVNYLKNRATPRGAEEVYIFPKGKNWNSDNYGELTVPKEGHIINLTLSNIDEWETFINRELEKEAVTVKNGKIYINGNESDTYTVKKDYYFMMGDNRDNSLDSRYWGFVSRDRIVGSPIVVLWSVDPDVSILNPFKLLSTLRFDRIGKLIN